MKITERWVRLAVVLLLVLQAAQMVYIVHRESLTFDEDDHMFSGYMMGHSGDYGLNPEHPPLVKLLAALPMFGHSLWVPPLRHRSFKEEAYLDGRDWLARNDGGSQRMVFHMRLAVGLLSLALSLLVFLAAREWFGTEAGLLALAILVFDPNILAHSALVTTDMGATLFFLASIYAFYRYVKQPSLARLAIAGLAAGLLLASKHSGILLAPMLLVLIGWEIAFAAKGSRGRLALRLSGAFATIVVLGVVVLWAFYGFRFAARPAGLELNPSLANYASGLSHFNAAVILAFAHLRLLPESYLMGLVDVKLMAQFYPTFLLGKVYAHGQWMYFPLVILIKTTLGLLAMVALAIFAAVTGRLKRGRELVYLLLPGAVYLAIAMLAGMDIGVRHILLLYVIAAIFAGAGLSALMAQNRRWLWVGCVLFAAHAVSALAAFPNDMAYANEAWGGPANLHNLLSDANVDWAQQLLQVKQWQDRHPGQECWFAYFARPEIDPAVYGIRCHALPTADTGWLGGAEIVPPVIDGYVLISAGDLSGCEWASGQLNPYLAFQSLRPEEMIDYGVLVYHGSFRVSQAAALSRAQNASHLLKLHKPQEALELAREAVRIDPAEIYAQTALGDAAASLGRKDEARTAYQAALRVASNLEPGAQESYMPDLEAKLKPM